MIALKKKQILSVYDLATTDVNDPMQERLLRIEDVAIILSLSEDCVRKKARKHEIPFFKLGQRQWRIRRHVFMEWLQEQADEFQE